MLKIRFYYEVYPVDIILHFSLKVFAQQKLKERTMSIIFQKRLEFHVHVRA